MDHDAGLVAGVADRLRAMRAKARSVGADFSDARTRVMTMSRPFGALLIGLGMVLIGGVGGDRGCGRGARGARGTRHRADCGTDQAGLARGERLRWWGALSSCLSGDHLWRQEIATIQRQCLSPACDAG